MGKIKVKLISGIDDEKSVISAFKVGADSYVVFDSESTGSMGLPIILVSKLVGNKLSKVIDQNEWQKTKEYLKLIISDAQMEYIVVPSDISAEEVFNTQLTLPQASFDAIKNNYKPVPSGNDGVVASSAPFVPNIEVTPISPAAPSIPSPVQAPVAAPIVNNINVEMPAPVVAPSEPVVNAVPVAEPIIAPVVAPTMPVTPIIEAPITAGVVNNADVQTPIAEPILNQPVQVVETPIMPMPSVVSASPVVEPVKIPIPVMPEIPAVSVEAPKIPMPEIPVIPEVPVVAPVIPITPVINPIIPEIPNASNMTAAPVINQNEVTHEANVNGVVINTPDIKAEDNITNVDKYKDMKETFMKSCENMFDALLKEMENKN